MLEIITGNLLEAKEKYLAHITNCISTTSAKGIAKDIFDKFPYADCYSGRTETSKAGTIDIVGDGKDNRYIINMHAIVYPGKARYPLSSLDGLAARQKHFYHCLLRIAQIEELESVAFPWRVGCGLAGGNWEYFLGTIVQMEKYLEPKGVRVVIYRKEGDE